MMTYQEYMDISKAAKTTHDPAAYGAHNQFYAEVGEAIKISLPEILIDLCKKSDDRHYNDIHLDSWIEYARHSKPQIAQEMALRGGPPCSDADCVATLKASIRHFLVKEHALEDRIEQLPGMGL